MSAAPPPLAPPCAPRPHAAHPATLDPARREPARHEVDVLLRRLGLQAHTAAFEEEEVTELWLLRSMGAALLANLVELGMSLPEAQTLASALRDETAGEGREERAEEEAVRLEENVNHLQSEEAVLHEENVEASESEEAVRLEENVEASENEKAVRLEENVEASESEDELLLEENVDRSESEDEAVVLEENVKEGAAELEEEKVKEGAAELEKKKVKEGAVQLEEKVKEGTVKEEKVKQNAVQLKEKKVKEGALQVEEKGKEENLKEKVNEGTAKEKEKEGVVQVTEKGKEEMWKESAVQLKEKLKEKVKEEKVKEEKVKEEKVKEEKVKEGAVQLKEKKLKEGAVQNVLANGELKRLQNGSPPEAKAPPRSAETSDPPNRKAPPPLAHEELTQSAGSRGKEQSEPPISAEKEAAMKERVSAVRALLREEAAFWRAGRQVVMRSWGEAEGAAPRGGTLVLAFGGLQQQLGGGVGAGVPPMEFVAACRRAGARRALFARDPTRAWYCRGLGADAPSFDGALALLRAAVREVRPARLLTIGSSMGAYAAVRFGLALCADVALAFSPQVLIDSNARKAAALPEMMFDEVLHWLRLVAHFEQLELKPLTDCVRDAPAGCRTQIEVHVGGDEPGDVAEAEMLRAAVEQRRAARKRQGAAAEGGVGIVVHTHAARDHNLVVDMRNSGELHALLTRHIGEEPTEGVLTHTQETSLEGLDVAELRTRGQAAYRAAEYAEAKRFFSAAVERKPRDASAACDLAAALLATEDFEGALGAAERALRLKPASAVAWGRRVRALRMLRRLADAVVCCKALESVLLAGGTWAAREMDAAVRELHALQADLPRMLAPTESRDPSAQLKAWEAIVRRDPTSMYARVELAVCRLAEAVRLKEELRPPFRLAKGSKASRALALASLARHTLLAVLADHEAYARARTRLTDLLQLLDERRPNVPLPAAESGGALRQLLCRCEWQLGLACETIHALDPSEQSVLVASAGAGSRKRSVVHFARASELDGSVWNVWQLWAEALATEPFGSEAERRAAIGAVHAGAVRAGVWLNAEQRPAKFFRSLYASAWHQPHQSAVCRALEAAYDVIKAEALALLQQDPSVGCFKAYDSPALASGEWCDVGLYYNAKRNEANARRAPRTSALLSGDGTLRRDATSCPFGSAYFSLLRPGTRLHPHCGPTNARLRAHLGLVVPEGECKMGVGSGPPRAWAEGKVLLFDDSFEHYVFNHTDRPRLVLIVDMWHPDLSTDEARLATMDDDEMKDNYLAVVRHGTYRNTIERGH
ncbi:hypothetical protein AB1Y20_022801 [Prymnesium parvum]|uniref:Aspartyl/asparaginy/proline hydroxylase domain-containing protein n=1 Tax=Prymnesium parvum TaxID=97485 RepID=A0AB34JDM9_PRYPA